MSVSEHGCDAASISLRPLVKDIKLACWVFFFWWGEGAGLNSIYSLYLERLYKGHDWLYMNAVLFLLRLILKDLIIQLEVLEKRLSRPVF